MKKLANIFSAFTSFSLLVMASSCTTNNSSSNISSEISKNEFTVTFKNYDGSILEVDENVEKDSIPSYDGEYPIGPSLGKNNTYKRVLKDFVLEDDPDNLNKTVKKDMTLVATYYDNMIYYGSYPQSFVSDDGLRKTLSDSVGIPTNSNASSKWSIFDSYNESNYSGSVRNYGTAYMIDLDIDNDGMNDYRGEYFTAHSFASHGETETNYTGVMASNYTNKEILWYKYEPITWNIVDKKDGKALITTNYSLEYSKFNSISQDDKFEHNGGLGYSNNYEFSDIRKWLNDYFYNSSFNNKEKEILKKEEVKNDLSSTGVTENNYICNNTLDNIFLLSKEEVKKYNLDTLIYPTPCAYHNDRKITTYSLYSFWTRSPYTKANMVELGYVQSSLHNEYDNNELVNKKEGIRPALWIEL